MRSRGQPVDNDPVQFLGIMCPSARPKILVKMASVSLLFFRVRFWILKIWDGLVSGEASLPSPIPRGGYSRLPGTVSRIQGGPIVARQLRYARFLNDERRLVGQALSTTIYSVL